MTMFSRSQNLRGGTSIVTVAIVSLLPAAAFAQTGPMTSAPLASHTTPVSESPPPSPQDTADPVAPTRSRR